MPRFELKKYKTFKGMEGIGLNADLYVDGVKAAEVIDEANGGEMNFYWTSPEAEKKVMAHVESLPIIPSETECEKSIWPEGRKASLDEFMDELANEHEIKTKLRRQCKSKTLFRIPVDVANTKNGNYPYRILDVPWPDGRALVEKGAAKKGIPSCQIEFLNEKYMDTLFSETRAH